MTNQNNWSRGAINQIKDSRNASVKGHIRWFGLIQAKPREIRRENGMARSQERRENFAPAPGAMPGTMNKNISDVFQEIPLFKSASMLTEEHDQPYDC
jgi:hypothetical protein